MDRTTRYYRIEVVVSVPVVGTESGLPTAKSIEEEIRQRINLYSAASIVSARLVACRERRTPLERANAGDK